MPDWWDRFVGEVPPRLYLSVLFVPVASFITWWYEFRANKPVREMAVKRGDAENWRLAMNGLSSATGDVGQLQQFEDQTGESVGAVELAQQIADTMAKLVASAPEGKP